MDGSRAGLGALTHGRARRAGFDGVVCRVWARDPVESSLSVYSVASGVDRDHDGLSVPRIPRDLESRSMT